MQKKNVSFFSLETRRLYRSYVNLGENNNLINELSTKIKWWIFEPMLH